LNYPCILLLCHNDDLTIIKIETFWLLAACVLCLVPCAVYLTFALRF